MSAGKNKPNELYITRMYDAPVKTVWEVFTDPKHVAKWWGPRGFTLTTHSKDLKPGGHWNYTMHGPDGKDWENITTYHEVEKYSRLVYDHGASKDRPPLFRVTVTFEDVKGRTKMDMTMALESAEAAKEIKKFIKQAGGDSTWDRLGEYLEKEASGTEVFIINRSFDAPIDLMYKMWTDAKHLSHWMGPAGSEIKYLHTDIRPGGYSSYVMTMGNLTMYGRADYLEFHEPTQIVYTQHFTDKDGNMSRHPLAPTWPAYMKTVVQLTEEGPGRTRVTVTWAPHGKFTKEELETFIVGRAGMTQGWGGSFDKLDTYLEKVQ